MECLPKKVAVVERWPLVEVLLFIYHKCGCVSSKFTTMLLGDSILLQEYFKLLFVLPCLCFLQCKEPVKPIPKRGVGTD